jgi:Fe-S-cluster formation regulator IscX/YfhJ
MTIRRNESGDVEVRVNVFRNGQKLQSSDGNDDIYDFITGIEIYESITSSTIEVQLLFNDGSGFIGAMTGSEQFRIVIKGTILDRVYYVRAYNIEARTRMNTADSFIVNCASDEFFQNEITNVFGNSQVVFDSTSSSEIVEQLLKTDQRYIRTQKKIYIEESTNKQQFIATNWRPYDCIYWLAQRSTRKARKGGTLQNGFIFWENGLGLNFKSIDKIIDNVNNQTESDSNFTTGATKLYTYAYSTKSSGSDASDQFKIETIVFPEERDFLTGLRNGAWAGFSMGFDPVTVTQSKMGLSTDMSVNAYRYGIDAMWPKMSHLNESKAVNPLSQLDDNIKQITQYPRRTRYTALSNQIFDPKFQDNPQKNYEELVELQAYQWMRFESLKNIKLMIKFPGNLDLYAGSGMNVIIPATYKRNQTTDIDRKYSGRYVIGGLTHKIVGTNMTTEALLLKDSIPRKTS